MVLKGFDIRNEFLKEEWLTRVYLPEFENRQLLVEMLRFDRIHPQISGNKWMKLEGWMEKYYTDGYKGIVTAGGPWSNHLHAAAYACLLHNIPMKAIIKGKEGLRNRMIEDLESCNVSIEYVNRKNFYDTDYWVGSSARQNELFIPMGGATNEGETGVTRWMDELPLPGYDYVLAAVGTATTLVGIGKSRLKFRHLWGFDPGTGDKSLPGKISFLNRETTAGKARLFSANQKLGKLSPGLGEFMGNWKSRTGITLDFVYTAPMCCAFLEMVNQGEIPPMSRVLLIHTGGTQGNRSHPMLPMGN